MDLCLDMERRPGLRTLTMWWEKDGLVLPGRPIEGEEGGDRDGDREEVGYGDERESEAEGIIQKNVNHRDGA